MEKEKRNDTSVDEYIGRYSEDIQEKLKSIRAVIHKAAPDAAEKISYQMPTYVLNGNLVHFAAFKNHIGFYPTPSGILQFSEELAGYKCSKGAVQFPLDKPIPIGLIEKMVKFRVEENLKKNQVKNLKG